MAHTPDQTAATDQDVHGAADIRPGPDIALLRSPLIHQLHDYWNAKRGGQAMPRRADIDPSEIKPLLPYVLLGEFKDDPVRLRYRLVGTEVVTIYGVDFTGRWLDELDFGDQVEQGWAAQYRTVFESRRPLYGTARLHATSGMEMRYEFGLFPLGEEDGAPTHCLDLNDYRQALQTARARWMQLQVLKREA
jgi:hypothetical protein